MDTQELKLLLSNSFKEALIHLEGDGYHYIITIVSESFSGLSKLSRQRMVNQVLMSAFQENKLHAVTIKAFTESEYKPS
jgi:acid stress-induced BolA-like protein IbaG/YrbA